MSRVGEHIHRLHNLKLIPALLQQLNVAHLRFRVARDVHNALRRQVRCSMQKLRRGTRTRRIHEKYQLLTCGFIGSGDGSIEVNNRSCIGFAVGFRRSTIESSDTRNSVFGLFPQLGRSIRPDFVHKLIRIFLGEFTHELGCICRNERCVLHTVVARVFPCVAHRRSITLNANDALRAARCRNQANRARAAIRINDGLRASQPRKLNGSVVQNFRLRCIDLVKRRRRNAEAQPAERIQNEARAIEHRFLLAQNHVRLAHVHILHHRCDLRHALDKFLRKRLARREFLFVRDDGHQHFAAFVTHAHYHMTHEALARVLVVRLDCMALHDGLDGGNNLLAHFVFNQTTRGGNQLMRALLVHARQNFAGQATLTALLFLVITLVGASGSFRLLNFLTRRKRADNLIAVAEGILHAQNRTQLEIATHALEKIGDQRVFQQKLLLVRQRNSFATATLDVHGTRGFHCLACARNSGREHRLLCGRSRYRACRAHGTRRTVEAI